MDHVQRVLRRSHLHTKVFDVKTSPPGSHTPTYVSRLEWTPTRHARNLVLMWSAWKKRDPGSEVYHDVTIRQ